MPFREKNGLRYFTLSSFDEFGIEHGFFTRAGGISPQPWASLNVATSVGDARENVIENRDRILKIFGKGFDSVFDTWQIHSDIVRCSESPRPVEKPHAEGDAVITSNPEVALLMVFADCVPVLFYDTKKYVIAIAHAGWQGTVKHIVCRTIEKMQAEYNSNVQDIIAGIGPSIGVDHYEIGGSTEASIMETFPGQEERIFQRRAGSLYFDMWQANALLLERYPLKSIEIAGVCTACDLDNWYSHRAENGKTGRFAAVLTTKK